ncbi:MAG: ankyrin repeat domain-containing protein [Allosphingosinicella sp.]|uniref:ankyrin repeat domain-containing protein n=1 Tax=Allosphingosinicella sp. TaxID=2823234 RepID=UPI003934960B
MKKVRGGLLAAAVAALVAIPAGAQFSESYSFLKAVRDRDGNKVTSIVSAPGSTVINTRDQSTGEGALHYVVRDRDTRWLSFLLSRGARADIANNQGASPLTLAAQLGWVEGAELLLQRGANVNHANSRGETPLILAVQTRDVAMVRLLMQNGANPNLTDNVAGFSALDYARRDNRAQALLRVMESTNQPARPAQGPRL